MSGDRELLELAAKAVGYRCCHHLTDGGWYVRDDVRNVGLDWNPLSDDADALRLAVKLGIAIYPPEVDGDDATVNAPGRMSLWISEPAVADPYAATRRAITRAAAELGKVKP
jgi:hypothetical protein